MLCAAPNTGLCRTRMERLREVSASSFQHSVPFQEWFWIFQGISTLKLPKQILFCFFQAFPWYNLESYHKKSTGIAQNWKDSLNLPFSPAAPSQRRTQPSFSNVCQAKCALYCQYLSCASIPRVMPPFRSNWHNPEQAVIINHNVLMKDKKKRNIYVADIFHSTFTLAFFKSWKGIWTEVEEGEVK